MDTQDLNKDKTYEIIKILEQSSISQNEQYISKIYPKYKDLIKGQTYCIKNIGNTNGSKLLITIDAILEQNSDNTFQLSGYVKLPSTENKDTRIVLLCKITQDDNIEIVSLTSSGVYMLMFQYIDKFIESALLPKPINYIDASNLLYKFNQSSIIKNCEKSFLGSQKCTNDFFKKLAGGKSGAFVYKVRYNTSSDLKNPVFKDCAFKIWKPRPQLFDEAGNGSNIDSDTANSRSIKYLKQKMF